MLELFATDPETFARYHTLTAERLQNPFSGEYPVDAELIPLLGELNTLPGLTTQHSCCGHEQGDWYLTLIYRRGDGEATVQQLLDQAARDARNVQLEFDHDMEWLSAPGDPEARLEQTVPRLTLRATLAGDITDESLRRDEVVRERRSEVFRGLQRFVRGWAAEIRRSGSSGTAP